MAEESFQERTEKATPKRRDKAREEGQVAKSMDLNSAIMILLGCLTLYLFGAHLSGGLMQLVRHTMANAPTIAISDPSYLKIFSTNLVRFFAILMPLFAIMLVLAIGANVGQVGFKISSKAIQPKFEKLNFIKGVQKLFSMRSAVSFLRDTLKLLIIGFIGYKSIAAEFEKFFLLPHMEIRELATTMMMMSFWIALKVGAGILVIAILDFIYQRYEFEKSIKMTKQEIRDEYKDTEGSPQIKARVRQIQREMSRKRMMADIPTADVVITNPTHLAVALKYDQEAMGAPQVIAKGERLIAQKIKEIAREHNIPIIEDKPLARSLYKLCDVGDLVPDTLYRAVAEILAYVYRLNGKVKR